MRIGQGFEPFVHADVDEDEGAVTHWLRKYTQTNGEVLLDFALAEAYLQEILSPCGKAQEQEEREDLFEFFPKAPF